MLRKEQEIREELEWAIMQKALLSGYQKELIRGYIKGLRYCLNVCLMDCGLEEDIRNDL